MGPGRVFYLLAILFFSQLACSDDLKAVAGNPTCRIVSPEDGATFTFGDTVAVEVEATAEGGGKLTVEFYADDTLWHVDPRAPFKYTLDGIPYRIGSRKISAVAVTADGARTADSIDVSIVSDAVPVYGTRVDFYYHHDAGAFTQGLVVDGDVFFEGTGEYGQSSIRRVKIETGMVEKIRPIPDEFFGEGIAIIGSTLYQLTWKQEVGFIYRVADFDSLGSFSYQGEGWGLTTDGTRLIMSDGTSQIRFLDPNTFDVVRTMEVTIDGFPLVYLNELEYVDGDLLANVWYDTRIARISLESGEVIGWINLRDISMAHRFQGLLNGVAYDPRSRGLYVTGKNWDKIYSIGLTH